MRSLSETQFIDGYVIPIFRARFDYVIYNHGVREFGRDIVFWSVDKFGDRRDYAAQIKIGDITGTSDNMNEMVGQIITALTSPFFDNATQMHRDISMLYIITSGRITGNAEELIRLRVGPPLRNLVSFWDGQKTLQEFQRICSTILEYSIWDRMMMDTGLKDLLHEESFKQELSQWLRIFGEDRKMTYLQIIDSLTAILPGLTPVGAKIQSIDAPMRKPLIHWFAVLIVTTACYDYGKGGSFEFK